MRKCLLSPTSDSVPLSGNVTGVIGLIGFNSTLLFSLIGASTTVMPRPSLIVPMIFVSWSEFNFSSLPDSLRQRIAEFRGVSYMYNKQKSSSHAFSTVSSQ